MNNLSSYCGLVDAKIRASDKDLPVTEILGKIWLFSANKIKKNSESFSKQQTQLIIELNSSLWHIIVKNK